ncbi:MAG: hypothetical protein ACRDNW_18675 [Trebonia sp.]
MACGDSFRPPLSSIAGTPPACGAVTGLASSSGRRNVHPLRIPHRFQEELQPLHRRQLRPRRRLGPGSAPARAVSVDGGAWAGMVLHLGGKHYVGQMKGTGHADFDMIPVN